MDDEVSTRRNLLEIFIPVFGSCFDVAEAAGSVADEEIVSSYVRHPSVCLVRRDSPAFNTSKINFFI